MKIFSVIAAVTLMVSSVVWGQPSHAKTLDELAAYKGGDREKILLEGAEAEGKVVWYTSLTSTTYKGIVKAFTEKYPDVEIEVYRAGSKDIAPKILGEAKAGRHLVDAIESTPGILMLLRDKKIIRPYTSPHHEKYPDEARTKADAGGVYWVTDREAFIGFGYNTKLIAEKDVPKNFDDLLKPHLKNKMALPISSTGDRVIGTMLKFKGAEYVEKLKSQEIKLFKLSGSAMRDLIISGEIASSPGIFRNQALVKMEQGAPLNWVPMDVVISNAGGAGVVSKAPHPHAALLLVDFIIGPEGQAIFEKNKYGVAWKDYPFKREFPERGMSTMQYIREEKKWNRLLRDIAR
ncbi:MAG: extracellular solute-binding protein [Candidatus Binatia bacterium]